MYTLGIDTSNYATSLAVFDTAAEEVVCDRKRFLPVKPGELGLRQSDAVFHHTAALPELLRELHDRGLQMAVCSNKADEFSRVIVEHYFPGIFRLVRGNIPGTPVKPDPGVAKGIMERLGAEPGETLMVGDSDVDIHTGHNAGLRACGVTWGFRSRENLVDAGADVLADTTAELKAVILG